MKKLNNVIFIVVMLLLVFIFMPSCSNDTKLDEFKKQGKVITVRYDSNGGTYLDREGITLIDMFNPSDYTVDNDGYVHIKLVNPTDKSRPSSGAEGIYITKTNCFLLGWYTTRCIKTNASGNPVDEEGNELVEINNKYYLASDNTIEKTPQYEYSGYWDFNKNTIDYKIGSGELDITLYAVWLNYFTFNYYAYINNTWEQIGTNNFDYMTTNQEGSKTADKDTIWLPESDGCTLVYTHKYQNNSTYSFPQLENKGFVGAYLDKDLTNQITTSEFVHPGTVDYEHGTSVNPVVNIYCQYEDGVRYYISDPNQLVNNANLNGIYEIQNDLDFTNITWPTAFSLGTFNGKIYSKAGNTFEIKNIKITHANESSKVGGIFGKLSSECMIKDVKFSNIEYNLSYIGMRNRNANFGMFAGVIDESANISNVSVSGSLKIGAIALDQTSNIYLVASGDVSKINIIDKVHLTIYGTVRGEEYNYTIDPQTVNINEDGLITFTSVTSKKLTDAEVVIQ